MRKIRQMTRLVLSTGERITEPVAVPVTLPKYIAAINRLNTDAHIYGFVYLPCDEDYEQYIIE